MRNLVWRRASAMFLALVLLTGLLPAAVAASPADPADVEIEAANDTNNFDYEYDAVTVEAGRNGIVTQSFTRPFGAQPGDVYAAILPVNADGSPLSGKDVRYVRLSGSGSQLTLTYFRDGCTRFRVMLVQPQPDGGGTAITASPASITHYTANGSSHTYTVTFTATLDMSATLAQIADLNQNDLQMGDLTFIAHIRFDSELRGNQSSIQLSSDIFEIAANGIATAAGENGFDIECTLKGDWRNTATGQTLVQKLQQQMTFTGTATITGGDIQRLINAGQSGLYVVGWNSIEGIPAAVLGGGQIQVPAVTCVLPISVRDNSSSGDDDGGGSSSGGSSSRYYDIEVLSADNGSVESSHDRARRGTRVTITVDPDNGYRVGSLTVMDADGDHISVTDNGDGTYTFTMPSSRVDVLASFVRDIEDPDDTGVSALLNTTDHMAYMVGDGNGNFRPDASITRAEVAQIFYRLLRNQNVAVTASFSDVAPDAWYADAVYALASLGIVNGVGGGQFAPERAITRAEFAAIAARFADSATVTVTFSDVPAAHWAYEEISTAATYGWVTGVGGGLFAPDRLITRAEAATMVNRMLGRLCDEDAIDSGEATNFPDVTDAHWAWYDIGEATTSHSYTIESGAESWID